MLLLNLLCVLFTSLFNVSNVKSDVIKNDVIYQKQEIAPKRAFTNDEYTSKVINKTAYRYTSLSYTLGVIPGGKNFEGRVSLYNGNYVNAETSYALDLSSVSQVNSYANSTYNTGVDVVTMFYQNFTFNGDSNWFQFRFIANSTTKCKNIEFTITGDVDGDSGLVIGLGSRLNIQSGMPQVVIDDRPSLLIHNTYSLLNTEGVTAEGVSKGFAFCDYIFFGHLLNSSATITYEVNLLGEFDLDYQTGYDSGYTAGRGDGYTNGYQTGYNVGYNEGASQDETALTIFTGILEVGMLPVNVFLAIFNFEVFGINISGIVSALLTVSVVIIILRFLLGGKTKDD